MPGITQTLTAAYVPAWCEEKNWPGNPKKKKSETKRIDKKMHVPKASILVFAPTTYYDLVSFILKYLKTEQIRILETPWSGRHSLNGKP